ncbi:MAG: hypothetical protein ABI779_13805 [Acidobacteriota bacterium]
MKTSRAALSFLCLLLALSAMGAQEPTEEKGFKPEKMYSFGSLDHVNTFNGNLMVSIPIGMRYPLDGGLTYGLTLSYNSKVWDFEEWGIYQASSPSLRANAGLGWLLSMGRLVPPQDPTNQNNEWLYEAADGSDHSFSANVLYSNAACTGAYCSKTRYTYDGSFLRMQELSPTLRSVESGDGTSSEFELVNDVWRLKRISNAFKNSSGSPLNYVNVTYPSPAGITYCPQATSVWQLNDSKGRSHFVCFKTQNLGGDPAPMVDRVVLAGVGQYATYLFEYDVNVTIQKSCRDTVPWDDPNHPPAEYQVPFLKAVKLPDGSDPACPSGQCSSFSFQSFVTGCPTGGLQTLTLPTLGKISYTYGVKNFQPNAPCGRLSPGTVGVSTRTLSNAVGAEIGVWGYEIHDVVKPGLDQRSFGPCWTGVGPGGGDPDDPSGTVPEHYPVIHDEAVGTVTDPSGNRVVQHYSVWPGNPGDPFDDISSDGFSLWNYGLAIGKFDPNVNANLSTEWFACANCPFSRKSYVRYHSDPVGVPVENAHQTVTAERTVYDDGRYAHVEYSDYDGFGHFRTAVTSGNFDTVANGNVDDANKRTTYTNFNPGADSNGRVNGFLVFSTSDPWILGTYDTTTRTDTTGSVTSKYCFDRTTGLLKAMRVGDQSSVKDLVTMFVPEKVNGFANGNVASEQFYGGDSTPLSSTEAVKTICTIAAENVAPGPLGYQVDHTYSYGIRATSRYAGMTFFLLDRDIDPTGLTVSRREPDGQLFTTYGYDRAGRLLSVQPPGGKSATTYAYTKASLANGTFMPALVSATTNSTSSGSLKVEYQFDALGRFWREKHLMPNGSWNVRERQYDAFDRATKVSELETLPSSEFSFVPQHWTEYNGYDAFGRAGEIKSPDGSKTTFVFKGVSETTRTSTLATAGTDAAVATVETYDRHGRLIRVSDPVVVSTNPPAPLTLLPPAAASYRYDVADHLSSVTMGIQSRIFDYDSRGFLRWESHPESGMAAYTYDARGNVLTKTQGAANTLFDLTYEYDGAERLLRVRGRNPHYNPSSPNDPDQPQFRLMREFTYGTENSGGDRRLGKLWTASRYNYDPADPTGDVYKIKETYSYGDSSGQKDSIRTNITKGFGANEAWWEDYREIQMNALYDDLNLPTLVQYPYCVDCGTPPGPNRQLGYSYTNGRVSSVPGFLTSASYWPNGMWNTLARGNGVSDTQTLDASGMARPASISAGLSNSCAAPVIVTDPVGGTVTSSQSVTLSVGVSGTPPFNYEWHNDSGIVGTQPSFNANSSNTTATTRYWVMVSNACKTVQSVGATVSVGECLAPDGLATFTRKSDGTYTLEVDPTGSEPRTYLWRRTSDQVQIGTTRKVTVGPLSSNTTYSVTLTNCSGTPVTRSVTVTMAPSASMPVLTATRTPSMNQIGLAWTGPTSGVAYTVQKRSDVAGWVDLVELNPTQLAARAYTDNAVVSGKTYAYRLRTPSDPSYGASYSNADVATTFTFSAVSTGSAVTATSFNSMLAAVNSVRAAVGWPAVSWSNILSSRDPLPQPSSIILGTHVTTCRARMNEALQALGAGVTPYTGEDLRGQVILGTHINEIIGRAY